MKRCVATILIILATNGSLCSHADSPRSPLHILSALGPALLRLVDLGYQLLCLVSHKITFVTFFSWCARVASVR